MEHNPQDEECIEHLLRHDDEFRRLHVEHTELKGHISAIEARTHLTESEELEEQQLKKRKLFVKDRLTGMISHYKQAVAS